MPFPIEVRTVAADDALLSTAAGRDSGFVAVHMFDGMEWGPYFRAVEAIMDELRRAPALGQAPLPDRRDAAPALSGLGPLPGRPPRLDPDGVFANAWTDRVLGPVGV